jgi:hypothetical protein
MRNKFSASIYFVVLISFTALFNSCSDNSVSTSSTWTSKSPLASTFKGDFTYDWVSATYRILMDDQAPNPPRATRIFSYLTVAMYESVAPGIPYSRSLAGQLRNMPQMPQISSDSVYDWPSVITGSASGVIRALFDTLYPPHINLINQTYSNEYDSRVSAVGQEIVDRSIRHGNDIANAIIQWSTTDNYRETRTMHYTIPVRDAQHPWYWEPINPGESVVEPFWGLIRPFVLETPDMFTIHHPLPFDTVLGSPFCGDAEEVNQIGLHLTQEQKEIAVFWNDKLRTGTPGGHWFSIAKQIMSANNYKLDRAAQIFVVLGAAERDAFIAAWKEKFEKNLLRPEDFIRHYVNPDFYPYILTPPFPEYPSGHSTTSGTSSEVLTEMIGGNIAFTDNTHVPINLPPRSFSSFYAAAEEAGMSRMYGGIHFRTAKVNGITIGRSIGSYAVSKIKFYIYQP